MKPFVYILDTNVILHDINSIFAFGQNDVVIPITVFVELDKLKKGKDVVSAKARAAIRLIDSLTEQKENHYYLGDDRGTLTIAIDDEFILQNKQNTNDNAILECSVEFSRDTTKTYILVTRDINLRIKAKSLGLKTQDYDNDKIDGYSHLYLGYRTIEISREQLDEMFGKKRISASIIDSPVANEYYAIKCDGRTVFGKYDPYMRHISLIEEQSAGEIYPKNTQQIFALNALLDPNIPLVSISGTAGTGKTLLALAAAITKKRDFFQIHLAKSVEPVGRDLGFLPGSLEEKLAPHMDSYLDALEFIKCTKKTPASVDRLIQDDKIIFSATQFLRGRSLPNMLFVVDEIQNLKPIEIKTIVTRMGEGSKLVLLGDLDQIDTPNLDAGSNGLIYLMTKMKGSPLYAHITLTKGERSPLAEEASKLL